MSDKDAPQQPPPQQPPQSLLQAGSRVADSVIGGLGGSPSLLGLVLLNMAFIVGASWFLLQQEHYRHDERIALGELLRVCIVKPDVKP